MPTPETWRSLGDVPWSLDEALPEDTARLIYESGRSELLTSGSFPSRANSIAANNSDG
jgi:hypothetical protein